MANNVPTQIRIDSELKGQANALFSALGLDLSTAVNIFLRQCILHGGLPFSVELRGKDNGECPAAGDVEGRYTEGLTLQESTKAGCL